MNCWTGQTGSDTISSICPEGSANGPVLVGPDRPVVEVLVDYYTLSMAISFNSFATTVNSMGTLDSTKDSALNWYVRPWA